MVAEIVSFVTAGLIISNCCFFAIQELPLVIDTERRTEQAFKTEIS
jgi:hypothetical protein